MLTHAFRVGWAVLSGEHCTEALGGLDMIVKPCLEELRCSLESERLASMEAPWDLPPYASITLHLPPCDLAGF
jgi:hypothetical protein